jgi:hypothetical protein
MSHEEDVIWSIILMWTFKQGFGQGELGEAVALHPWL